MKIFDIEDISKLIIIICFIFNLLKRQGGKTREKFGEGKISMLSNHIEDNVTKRVLTNTFSRLTLN